MTKNDKFIMLPTVDVCFKGLMYNPKVRKGFIAALLELQILELKKLPGDLREDDEVIQWMRFLAGKDRKELEDMASTSEYIEEAYRELERMSADERARLEYEARQKAIRDHDAIMSSAWETGMEKGLQEGREQGREQGLKQGREQGLKQGREQGLKQGREQGLKQGREQGIRQERQDIVFRMLGKGMAPEAIADLTGMDVEEVRELEKAFEARE